MANQVYSAPNAAVYIDGKKAGYVNNISWTENYNRATIKGLGSTFDQEVPVVGAGGTFTVSQFFLDFGSQGMKALMNRTGTTSETFLNTQSLGEFPFTVAMYEKTVVATDSANRLVTEVDVTGKRKILLKKCYIDSQGFSLAENGVASVNSSGRYLEPMTLS